MKIMLIMLKKNFRNVNLNPAIIYLGDHYFENLKAKHIILQHWYKITSVAILEDAKINFYFDQIKFSKYFYVYCEFHNNDSFIWKITI
ncbi:hypothetical protein NPX79_02860 [Spiroplasma endosymbiont of Anurida maritima]|uniref:hypothetical protein n=1 Tax=Spiroplasma endosymbiont of Anurida maritima TaxID=2967972 RepID=UPI0036D233E8